MAALKKHKQSVKDTYPAIKGFIETLFDCFYSLKVEGELPTEKPSILLSPHQNSLDGLSLIKGINDYLAFIYETNLRSRVVTGFGIHTDWIRVDTPRKWIWFKRLFSHLDNKNLVVGFPQQRFQRDEVTSIHCGIAELVRRYDALRGTKTPFIPVGIEYVFPKHLPHITPIPFFDFPFFGTSVTLRFGQPKYLDGENSAKLTEIVMRTAAELSNIPYRVQPT